MIVITKKNQKSEIVNKYGICFICYPPLSHGNNWGGGVEVIPWKPVDFRASMIATYIHMNFP